MNDQPSRRAQQPQQSERNTSPAPRRVWTKPETTIVLTCAEIGAYAFRAG